MNRRRWIRWVILSLSTTVLALVAGGLALTCRPGWYQPAGIDYAQLDADNRALINTLDRIGVALNGGQPIEVLLREDQVNRWIAGRDEWPEAVGRVDLGPLEGPQVAFLGGGRVRLAGMIERAGFGVVVSCDIRVELAEDDVILHWDGLRAGLMPIPRSTLRQVLAQFVPDRQDAQAALTAGRLVLPNRWIWPNGKRRFEIRGLEVTDDQARIMLSPADSRSPP